MNLEFGVCWIEDQASDAEVDAVEQAIRGAGFEPKIDRIESEEQIRTFAQQQEHFQDYDLILLDLRLGHGIRGDEIAPNVRAAFRSTPILFYSADTETNLRLKMAEQQVEGVYCVHRNGLPTRVGELVVGLSPALNRLSSMRGLSARVVAECDQELRAILLALGTPERADRITASIKERLRAVLESELQRTNQISDLPALLDDHAVSSGILFNEMRDQVRLIAGADAARDLLHQLRKYPNAVIKRRNTLAHALEERTVNGWRIVRSDARHPLTVGDFERYRRDFLTHLRDVRRLRELLVREQPD